MLGDGRSVLAAGDASGAVGQLRDALALWRGAPLGNLAVVEQVQGEIRRLGELRSLAVMERTDADLALGAGAELVAELERLVAGEPLQERLCGQLMLALYRAGRQTDALALYRQMSRRLRDELGLEPGRALQRLERLILKQDPMLERPVLPPPVAGNLPVALSTRRDSLITADQVTPGWARDTASAVVAVSDGAGGVGRTPTEGGRAFRSSAGSRIGRRPERRLPEGR